MTASLGQGGGKHVKLSAVVGLRMDDLTRLEVQERVCLFVGADEIGGCLVGDAKTGKERIERVPCANPFFSGIELFFLADAVKLFVKRRKRNFFLYHAECDVTGVGRCTGRDSGGAECDKGETE